MDETHHVVAARGHPHDGSADSGCEPAQQRFLGMRSSLRPETAAHVAREHTHLGAVEVQDLGESGSHRVRPLAGVDMVQASVVCPAARGNAGLQRAGCDAVVDRANLRHGFAPREVGLRVVECHAHDDVRLGHPLEQGGASERLFGIYKCRQRLVVDDDQFCRVDRCGRCVGHNDRDRFAHEPHTFSGQHRAHNRGIEGRARRRVRLEVDISRRDDVNHARRLACCAHIEPGDVSMRNRRGHEAGVRRALPVGISGEIGDELSLPAQQRLVLAPDDRCSPQCHESTPMPVRGHKSRRLWQVRALLTCAHGSGIVGGCPEMTSSRYQTADGSIESTSTISACSVAK